MRLLHGVKNFLTVNPLLFAPPLNYGKNFCYHKWQGDKIIQIVPGIFDKIQELGIEHIYTSFPEGRIHQETIKIGGKDAETLIGEMREQDIRIDDSAIGIVESKDFTVLKETEDIILVRLKVKSLGIPDLYPTTNDIYQRIEELSLELCPAEAGPHYRLQYQNQPAEERFSIGMKPIVNRYGNPAHLRAVARLGRLDAARPFFGAGRGRVVSRR